MFQLSEAFKMYWSSLIFLLKNILNLLNSLRLFSKLFLKNMRYKNYKIIFLFLILFSCSDADETRFSNFSSLHKNKEAENNFPNFISSDCSSFKEIHSFQTGNCFGRFIYSGSRIPQIFSNKNFKIISWEEFRRSSISIDDPKFPKWFIDYPENIMFYKSLEYLYAIDPTNKILYFLKRG